MVDNMATNTMATIQTTTPTGTISFVMNGGASPTYTAQSYLLAQQVNLLLDAFVLSGDNFSDLSSKLPLQLFQCAGGQDNHLITMVPGDIYLVYGAGFVPGSTATLTNDAQTVTAPVQFSMITPGMGQFIAPDNATPPWNGLDAGTTNTLTITNPDGKTFNSADATTPFTYGWS